MRAWIYLSTLLLLTAVGCVAVPPSTPALPSANAALQAILMDCWGVSQLKELDGTRLDHTRAFECARPRLLEMTRTYADAAEPHRLLAWGYYFALQDEDAARAEYERAAEIYRAQGHPTEEAEMLVQLASIAFKYDRARGCAILQNAAQIDASNSRAAQLLRNFGCLATPTPPAPPGTTNG